jgi:hypothetical protein
MILLDHDHFGIVSLTNPQHSNTASLPLVDTAWFWAVLMTTTRINRSP